MSRDWLDKDFYATLGVTKEASTEEIKKAYKKLARENHPDLNPGDTEAEKKFKEISEASSVLGDEKKRPGSCDGCFRVWRIWRTRV